MTDPRDPPKLGVARPDTKRGDPLERGVVCANTGQGGVRRSGRVRTVLRLVERIADGARRLIVNAAAFGATGLLVVVIVTGAFNGSYSIDPIEVPDAMAKGNFSGASLAALLKNEVGKVWLKSQSRVLIRPVVSDTAEPVINVTGTNLPLRYVSNLLRDTFLRPPTRISGQVIPPATDGTPEDVHGGTPWVHLVLETEGPLKPPFFDGEGRLSEILEKAAVQALAQIDIYAAALSMAQGSTADREKALRLVKVAEASAKNDELPLFVQKLLFSQSEVPRAELTLANIYYAMGDATQSKDHFSEANASYAARDLRGRDWYPAQDGLAWLAIDQRDWPTAVTAVTKALEQRDDYDSALYHRAQIDDIKSRYLFGNEHLENACEARVRLEAALVEYDRLLTLYPDFAVAYSQEGVMLFQEWHWLAVHRSLGCADAKEALPTRMNRLAAKATTLFHEALQRDPLLSDPWFQGANLLVEQIDFATSADAATREENRLRLNAAIEDYRKAAEVFADDFYIHARLGEALVRRATLKGPGAPADRQEAIAEYCRSVALDRSDSTYRNTLKGELASLGIGDCPGPPASP